MGMSFFLSPLLLYIVMRRDGTDRVYYSDPPSIKLSGIRYCRPDAVCIDALSNILVLETCLIEMIDKNGQFL